MKRAPSASSLNWDCKRLGDVAAISAGITLGRRLPETGTRRVPYLTVLNVKDGWLDLSEVRETEATAAEISRCKLQVGDVLLTEGGDPDKLGRGTYWRGEIAECILQNHVFRVRFSSDIDPAFMAFQFRSEYGKSYFFKHAKQTTGIATINRRVLANFPLLLPPINEQTRLAKMLDRQLVEFQRARVAVYEQLKAAEAIPTAVLRDVFAHAAPEWERRKLADICEITARQIDPRLPQYRDLPHVSGENIASGVCRLENVHSAAEDGMTSGKYLFEPGDILYSKLRPYLRKVALPRFRGLCSADMYPIRVNAAILDAQYAAWMLLSESFTNYAVAQSNRSRMPKLNRQQLFDWIAPIPPFAEQKRMAARICAEIAEAQNLIEHLSQKIALIENMPAALLTEAFSRKVGDVNGKE